MNAADSYLDESLSECLWDMDKNMNFNCDENETDKILRLHL